MMQEETTRTEFRPEPRLEDLLNDPLVHQMMRRDGIERDALRALIEQVGRTRSGRPCALC